MTATKKTWENRDCLFYCKEGNETCCHTKWKLAVTMLKSTHRLLILNVMSQVTFNNREWKHIITWEVRSVRYQMTRNGLADSINSICSGEPLEFDAVSKQFCFDVPENFLKRILDTIIFYKKLIGRYLIDVRDNLIVGTGRL